MARSISDLRISAPPMSGSSDAQASSESARRVNRSKRLCGLSFRSVPWRSNGKIDIRSENQRAADERLVGCPGKLGICSSRQPLQTLVRLELPERSLEIKWQDRYPI